MGDRDARGGGSRRHPAVTRRGAAPAAASRGRRSPRSCSAPTSRTSTGRSFRAISSASSSPGGRTGAAARCCLRGLQPAAAPGPARALPPVCPERVGVARRLRPVGMPLMVEPLVMQPSERRLRRRRRLEKIVPLVRQAVELGADVVKADPTDDLDDYGRVIEIAGRRPGARARRRSSVRRGDPAPDGGGDAAGRRRHRLRPQRHPARATRPAMTRR